MMMISASRTASRTASWSGGPSADMAQRLLICMRHAISVDLKERIVLVVLAQTLLHGLCAKKQSHHHEKKAHCASDICEHEKPVRDLSLYLSQKASKGHPWPAIPGHVQPTRNRDENLLG